jgi:hypothetical protein
MLENLSRQKVKVTDAVFGRLQATLPTASLEALRKGLDSPSQRVRRLCAKELVQRVEVDENLARSWTDAGDDELRWLGYVVLLDLGASVDVEMIESGKDDLKLKYFRRFDKSQLLAQLEWVSVNGPFVYQALAMDHFSAIADRIRTDLAEEFSTFKHRELARYADANAMPALLKQIEHLDSYLTETFIASALRGLIPHAIADDVEIARRYLKHSNRDVRSAAFDLLQRIGTEDDLPSLWAEAENVSTDLSRLNVIDAILALTKERAATIRRLLASSDPALLRKGIVAALGESELSDYLPERLSELLRSPHDAVRLTSLAAMSQGANLADLEDVLRKYLADGSYYYDVVAWLDRIIYAPQSLAASFRVDLQQHLLFQE